MTGLPPLAHPPRLRLTACQGCGLPLADDTAHPTAIQCRDALLVALAAVTAERDEYRGCRDAAMRAVARMEKKLARLVEDE